MRYHDKKVWPGRRFENYDSGDVERGRSLWFMLVRDRDEDLVFEGYISWDPDRSAPYEAYAEIM